MSQLPPTRSRQNLSLLIGFWIGLSLVAGISVFLLFYWALGGFDAPATAVALATATAPSLPTPATPLPTAAPTDSIKALPACAYPDPPASGFGYGIQSHAFVGDNQYFFTVIRDQLGLQWVKIQVRWDDMEKAPGQIDWGILDYIMDSACQKGLRVLLSAVAAPAWSIQNPMPASEGQAAPPDDFGQYAAFLAQLIDHYPGQIGAIEVWNEMNLEREWNTAGGVSPTEYARMLQTAYATVKSKDPSILVIAGALSPTGVNCNGAWPDCQPSGRPVVMDDASYLTQFVQAGGLEFADCVGTHSNGTNLPPAADGANPPDSAGYTFLGPWNSPHYSWALKSQVDTYAAILQGRRQQCVTEFGYASAVNGQFPPNYGFAADVSEQQQAEYLVAAFDWMRQSGLVKMAFLFNLDYGPKGGDPAEDDNVIFSILTREGAPRPAFDAIARMPKP